MDEYLVLLLFFMALSAIAFGWIGYRWGHIPEGMSDMLAPSMGHRLFADLWAHPASYVIGVPGGLTLCVLTWMGVA